MRLLLIQGARLLLNFVVFYLLLTFLVFLICDVLPSAAVRQLGTAAADTELLERTRQELGLQGGIVERYGQWLLSTLQLDFGKSLQGRFEVRTILFNSLKTSLPLWAVAALATGVAVLLAMLYAPRPIVAVAHWLRGVSVGGLAPAYLIAVLFYAVLVSLPWPIITENWSRANWLGAAIVVLLNPFAIAFLSASEQAQQLGSSDFVRTYRSIGLGWWRIRLLLLKNVLLVIRPQLARLMLAVLTGSIFAEQVFGIRGFGSVFVSALRAGDTPMLMAWMIVAGSIIGLCVAIERWE